MPSPARNLVWALLTVVMFFVAYLVWPQQDEPDYDWFLGTWHDPAGPPNNELRFYFVESPHSSNNSIMKALEGRYQLKGFFGVEEASGDWNFGDYKRTILNFSLNGDAFLLMLEPVSEDEMFMRCLDSSLEPDPSLFADVEKIRLIREQ